MVAYLVANFELTNPAGYKSYVPAVIPTLKAHGAEILVADYESEPRPAAKAGEHVLSAQNDVGDQLF